MSCWGSAGLGVATGHDSLASGALNSIYSQQNPTLGAALLAGKLQLIADRSAHLDLLDTFNLLGDPALQVNLAQSGTDVFLPTITTTTN